MDGIDRTPETNWPGCRHELRYFWTSSVVFRGSVAHTTITAPP